MARCPTEIGTLIVSTRRPLSVERSPLRCRQSRHRFRRRSVHRQRIADGFNVETKTWRKTVMTASNQRQPERKETRSMSFPGESREYCQARDRLLHREIDLRRTAEAVAQSRRQLPPGGLVREDYVFKGRGENGIPRD